MPGPHLITDPRSRVQTPAALPGPPLNYGEKRQGRLASARRSTSESHAHAPSRSARAPLRRRRRHVMTDYFRSMAEIDVRKACATARPTAGRIDNKILHSRATQDREQTTDCWKPRHKSRSIKQRFNANDMGKRNNDNRKK